ECAPLEIPCRDTTQFVNKRPDQSVKEVMIFNSRGAIVPARFTLLISQRCSRIESSSSKTRNPRSHHTDKQEKRRNRKKRSGICGLDLDEHARQHTRECERSDNTDDNTNRTQGQSFSNHQTEDP